MRVELASIIPLPKPVSFPCWQQSKDDWEWDKPAKCSSGGTFVTILCQSLSFAGLEVMISPGHAGAIQWMVEQPRTQTRTMAPPRIAFVYMPKDTTFAGTQEYVPPTRSVTGVLSSRDL
jgi:hypothetical protein